MHYILDLRELVSLHTIQSMDPGYIIYVAIDKKNLYSLNQQIVLEISKISQVYVIEYKGRVDLQDYAEQLKVEQFDVYMALENIHHFRPVSVNQMLKILVSIPAEKLAIITNITQSFIEADTKRPEKSRNSKMLYQKNRYSLFSALTLDFFTPKISIDSVKNTLLSAVIADTTVQRTIEINLHQ